MIKRRSKRARPRAYVIAETATRDAPAVERHICAHSGRSRLADRAKKRILMCAVVFAAVFASLAGRLAFVTFGKVALTTNVAAVQHDEQPRPEIVDRNGVLLATELPMRALEISGREVWDAHETAQKVAGVLPRVDAAALEEKLRAGRYVEVSDDITPAERQAIFDLGLPGVRFPARAKRYFPQHDLAAHVVGHDEEGKGGVMGLEKVANRWDGPGPIRASIDIRVQQVIEDELSLAAQKFSAKAGWAGVMDVATGELIALASYPDFDPNDPGAAPADSRRNRATYDRYELGSAFKSFTAAAALNVGITSEGARYDARHPFKVADRLITDYHAKNKVLTLSEVVQYSSNVGIAQVAEDLGAERQQAYLKNLGLLDPLPIELPENRAPQPPRQWGPVETATVAYGHGISVTPLHLLTAFAAVIDGGVFHDPTFLAADGPIQSHRVFSKETSAVMRRILRRVITDGTASKAEAKGYFPIGKTATADKPVAGGYNTHTRIASFIGAVPGYAPRYAILISLDEPQPTAETYGYATAGWNAAPAFSRIVERAAPLLGLAPVSENVALAAFVSGDMDDHREARAVTERRP